MKHKVVLHNPRAPFWTMPLALLAVGSAVDRRRFDPVVADGRLDPEDLLLGHLDDVWTTAHRLVFHGIGASIGVIVGFPDESRESVLDSLRVARELRSMSPDFEVNVFSYEPHPEAWCRRSSRRAATGSPSSSCRCWSSSAG